MASGYVDPEWYRNLPGPRSGYGQYSGAIGNRTSVGFGGGGGLPGGGGAPPGYGGLGFNFGGAGGYGAGPPVSANANLSGIAGRIGGAAEDVWRWAQKNPEIALGVLGTGANIWGAHQAGKREDRRADLDEEQVRARIKEDEERRRRVNAAWQEIQARRAGRV